MKRFVWFLLAGSLVMGCAKQADETHVLEQYLTIQASLGRSADTKTCLDGVQVKWESDDEIALWYGVLNTSMKDEQYTVASIDGEDAREANFHGFAPAGEWDAYMGVYPYSASDGCSKKGKLTVTLPTLQTATAGSFGHGANLAVAYSTTTDLAFKNVGGLMAVTLASTGGHTVKAMRLTGTSALSGKVEIEKASIEAETPVASVTDGVDYVELTGTFTAGNTYYFVVLPGSHTGFTLQLYDDAGRIATATSSSQAFEITRNSNTLIANLSVPENKWKTEEKVFLNEIQPNESPFVELYNDSRSEETLKDWTPWVNGSKVWTGTDQVLSVGGLLVLNGIACPADKNVKVELKNPEGVVRDNYIRGEEGGGWGSIDLPGNASASFSRVPNGTGAWKYAAPTPGAENGEKTGTIEQYPAANGVVVLNEINGNDKFIELYSTATDQKISLEDMTIQKDGGLVWTGQAGYYIEPGGYVLLYSTDVTKPGKAHEGYDAGMQFDSGLSAKKAVRVQLFAVDGSSLDDFNYVTYSGTAAQASYGRNADGVWYYQAATPGAANTDGDTPMTGLE